MADLQQDEYNGSGGKGQNNKLLPLRSNRGVSSSVYKGQSSKHNGFSTDVSQDNTDPSNDYEMGYPNKKSPIKHVDWSKHKNPLAPQSLA